MRVLNVIIAAATCLIFWAAGIALALVAGYGAAAVVHFATMGFFGVAKSTLATIFGAALGAGVTMFWGAVFFGALRKL